MRRRKKIRRIESVRVFISMKQAAISLFMSKKKNRPRGLLRAIKFLGVLFDLVRV